MAERHDRLCHASASDGQSVLVVARPATPLVGRYSRTHAGAFRGRLATNSLSSAVRGAHIVPPPVAEGEGTRGFLRARLSGERAVLAGLDRWDVYADLERLAPCARMGRRKLFPA